MTTTKLSSKHNAAKKCIRHPTKPYWVAVDVSQQEAMRKAAKRKAAEARKLVRSRLQKIKELLDRLDEEYLISDMTDVRGQDESPIKPCYERRTQDSQQACRIYILDKFIQEEFRDVDHKIQSIRDEKVISTDQCQQFETQRQQLSGRYWSDE